MVTVGTEPWFHRRPPLSAWSAHGGGDDVEHPLSFDAAGLRSRSLVPGRTTICVIFLHGANEHPHAVLPSEA